MSKVKVARLFAAVVPAAAVAGPAGGAAVPPGVSWT